MGLASGMHGNRLAMPFSKQSSLPLGSNLCPSLIITQRIISVSLNTPARNPRIFLGASMARYPFPQCPTGTPHAHPTKTIDIRHTIYPS